MQIKKCSEYYAIMTEIECIENNAKIEIHITILPMLEEKLYHIMFVILGSQSLSPEEKRNHEMPKF